MLQLHEFQETLLAEARVLLRTHKRIVIQSPTGSGKTILSAFMTSTAVSRGYRIWFNVHRRELVQQSAGRFDQVGLGYGIIANGWPANWHRSVQICSVQTLARRLTRLQAPGLMIWDECHHVAAKTWATIFKTFPDATHIGLSATPGRLDGKGLGDYFEAMCCGPSTKWLIDNGFLVPYRLFSVPGVSTEGMHHLAGDFNRKEVVAALEKSTVTGDAVKHYRTHAMGRRALVFEASRERSERCAQAFRDAGIPAAHVDGETDPGVRDRAMRDLESGALRVLCNVDLFGEGVDVPAIEAVFLCRPTDSLTVYLQQVGRGLRTCQGKEDVLIFDHAGNAHRHGRPDDEREWKLTRTPIKEKEQDNGVAVRQCPYCYAVSPRAATVCVDCKQPFPVNGREITDADGVLVEDPIIAERRRAREAQSRADSLEKLEELGRMRGYKDPVAWAKYVWEGRSKKRAGRAA